MAATDASKKRRRPTVRTPKGQPPRDNQLHPTFTDFQRWVIDRLVGVYANDANNVVVQITARWIDENKESLKEKEITFPVWRSSPKPTVNGS